jgi:tetratricopeptide (TPR) repeat protein
MIPIPKLVTSLAISVITIVLIISTSVVQIQLAYAGGKSPYEYLSQTNYRSDTAFGVELLAAEPSRNTVPIPNTLDITSISMSSGSEEQLAQSYLSRGDILYQAGRCNESLDAINQGLEIDPESDFGYNSLGNTLDCLGRYEEALSAYDKALELLNRTSPQDSESLAIYYTNKGSTLDNFGRYEEAIQVYDQALALDPSYADAHINKGVSLSNLERYEEALQEDQIAISLNPDDPLAHSNKGYDLLSLERYEEAIQAFDQALALDPSYVDAYTGKGDVLNLLGRQDEALLEYDKAISISFGNATNTTTNQTSGNATRAELIDTGNQTLPGIANNTIQQQNTIQQTDSMLTYENYGIRLQYPADWKQQPNLRPVFDILFIPSGENESLPMTGIGFKTVNIPSSIFTLDQDPDSVYMAIEEIGPIFLKSIIPDFLLTGSERSTLAGMAAYNIRFIGHIGGGVTAVQATILIHGDKLYMLSYFAPPEVFANQLIAANSMIDSFELIE